MSGIKGLGHVGILAKNMSESIKFYQDNLGFKLEKEGKIPSENGEVKLSILSAGTCTIELIQRPEKEMNISNVGPLIEHLCIEVEDIEQVKKELSDKGIKFETKEVNIMPELFGGVKNIFFSGPSGERLELFENI